MGTVATVKAGLGAIPQPCYDKAWVGIDQDGGDAAAGCLDKVGRCTAEEDLIV